ncbi:hypothetical protein [Streptomyces sp. ISL-100]|uniref:hypothetical protein n=1 Tax=Streptomyces sp. ISL-100 TaxID=2819173 RepID=UPI001BEA2BD2|nr:hypothetical protein [Streptomyces sp. ISL-100]MBT2394912.1 hypothetical protein [Streptomyces sp. ISL-100]
MGDGQPCPWAVSAVAQGMIKAKSVLAVAALAAGVSALAAPGASAAESSDRQYRLDVPKELDKLGALAVPAERRDEVPSVTGQLKSLGQLHKLNELQQFTGMLTPATGLVPAVE